MRKILALLVSLLWCSGVFAGTNVTVMVEKSTGVITYPTNFVSANSLQTTGGVGSIGSRVTVLETTVPANSNALNAKIITATNATQIVATNLTVVQTNVAVISTNYASIASVAASTNAYVAWTNALVNWQWTNISITTTGSISATSGLYGAFLTVTGTVSCSNISALGTITATNFVGNGAGLTGIVSAVTAGVNQITVAATNASGWTNLIGNITFAGVGITNTVGNTVTVYHVEYISKQIALSSNVFEYTMEGPRGESFTLDQIFSKADAYNATFDFVTCASNSAWRGAITTNIAAITAASNGTWTITNLAVTAGQEWGIKVTDFDSRATQIRVQYKIRY